ncbi:MAG: phosphoglycerate kinase, partial [Parachlamydiaceae bacterium]
MNPILPINELPIKEKRVLVRVDFNVPIQNGKVTDASRIKASLPTIKYILDQGGAAILMSHLGKPKDHEPEYSLFPVAKELSQLLGKPVKFATTHDVKDVKPGDVYLLENLRYNPAEEKPEKDPSFAEKLAKWGDFYVDDAFGSAHRAHTSVTEVPKLFKGKRAAGFLMLDEIKYLGDALSNPKHPFIAIVGGAKISTKLKVLSALTQKCEKVLVGGAMAYTIMKALNGQIGNSLHEPELLDTAKKLWNNKILLPIDHVCEKDGAIKVFEGGIPDGWVGMDIGPKTVDLYIAECRKAKTIFWNGPLGVFE